MADNQIGPSALRLDAQRFEVRPFVDPDLSSDDRSHDGILRHIGLVASMLNFGNFMPCIGELFERL
jgi:hypothetical protein